jgi:hypothetical protein
LFARNQQVSDTRALLDNRPDGHEADSHATFESDLLAKHHAERNFIKLMSGDPATHPARR